MFFYNSSSGSWVSFVVSDFCSNPLSFKRPTIPSSSNSAMATRCTKDEEKKQSAQLPRAYACKRLQDITAQEERRQKEKKDQQPSPNR